MKSQIKNKNNRKFNLWNYLLLIPTLNKISRCHFFFFFFALLEEKIYEKSRQNSQSSSLNYLFQSFFHL